MTAAAIVDVRNALQALFGGRGPEANVALERLVVDHLDIIAADFFAYADALTLSLAQRDLTLARHLTQARFPAGKSYEFDLANDQLTLAEHHFRWTAKPYGHRLTLNLSFLQQVSGQSIIGNRIACVLPLIDSYDVDRFGAGSAVVDLGDWSAGVGLSFSDNRFDSLLIPDSSFLGSDGYEGARLAFDQAPAWGLREPRAVWRGSSTGSARGSVMDIPRVKLCRIGSAREDIIDSGITHVVQAETPEDAASLRDSGLCKSFLSMPEHARFKYQIDIDGNTNSWPGLFQKLLSGSPVLKVASPELYRQWYYPRLRPWENFVPIRSDMADLAETIDFLRANDDIAQRIGLASRELALSMTMAREVETCQATIRAAFCRDRFQRRDKS